MGPARAVLRRHLRLAPHRLPLGPGDAGRARPALRLRRCLHGRARPVRLPAALAAGQRLVLPQARPRGTGALARARRPPARAHDGARGGRRALPGDTRDGGDGRPLAGSRARHDRAAGRALRVRRARAWPRGAGPRPRPGRSGVENGRIVPCERSGRGRRRGANRRLPDPARGDGVRARRPPPRGVALRRGAPRAGTRRGGAGDVAGARRARRARSRA